MRAVQIASCHPERRHKAKGLCSTCYNQWHKASNPKANDAYNSRYRAERRELLKDKEKTRREKNPETFRDYWYKKKYGMTRKDVVDMLDSQGNACAVCRCGITEDSKHVDHCHVTGHVRGLLCAGCNTAIGKLGDNVEGLKRALSYLEKEPSKFKA